MQSLKPSPYQIPQVNGGGEQMRLFEEALRELSDLNRDYNNNRSFCSKKCSSHVNIAANQLAAHIIGWPDTSIVELIRDGANPLGPQQKFGIYRTKYIPPALSFEDLEASNEKFRLSLESRPPTP